MAPAKRITHVNGSEWSRVQEFSSEKITRDIGLYNLMGMGASENSLPLQEPTVAAKAASENSLVTSHGNLARKCC